MPNKTVKPKEVKTAPKKAGAPAVVVANTVPAKKAPAQVSKSSGVKKLPPKSVGAARVIKTGQKIAMFVDIDNTNVSPTNLLEVLSHLGQMGTVVFTKIYGYSDDKVERFEEFITEHRFETVGRMRFKQDGVSVVDTRLVVDVIRLTEVNKFDLVFIWAGRGDLVPLFSYLKEVGVKTATIDLEHIDSQNRFVDSRIKLFSEYAPQGQFFSSNILRPLPIKNDDEDFDDREEVRTNLVPDILAGYTPPELPRRRGAPAFGEVESTSSFLTQNQQEEVEVTEQDIYNMVQDFNKIYEEEKKQELSNNTDEFGELMGFGEIPEKPQEKQDFATPIVKPDSTNIDLGAGLDDLGILEPIVPVRYNEEGTGTVSAKHNIKQVEEKVEVKSQFAEEVMDVAKKPEKTNDKPKKEGKMSYSFKKDKTQPKKEKSMDAYDDGTSLKYRPTDDGEGEGVVKADEDPYADFSASLSDFTS